MIKNVSILGSTGTIGLNSLKIFKRSKDKFRYNVFVADKNFKLICSQIKIFKPKIFIVNNFKVYQNIKKKFKNSKVLILNNLNDNNNKIKQSDVTVAAIPGIAGLKATIEFTKKSKKILIANKESIICGWKLIKNAAIKSKTKIVPVDSEHFSIMKLLENHEIEDVNKVYLTASGGPFLNYKINKLKNIKPLDAIKHPKWKMGKKISVDSATLMNKMLEIIEASKLFSIDLNKIDIVIHPDSLVHAIVEFKSGLHRFIYHETSMLIPLANAIFDRKIEVYDFIKSIQKKKKLIIKNLNFLKVNVKRFPVIKIKNKLTKHVSTPIIINAANEILVDQFLKKKIAFNSFYKHLQSVLRDRNYKKYAIKEPKNISQIFQIDRWSRDTTYKLIKKN